MSPPGVSMVFPDSDETGIGPYTREILAEFDDIDVDVISLDYGSLNPFHYVLLPVRSYLKNDVIHIQHEYGLFGPSGVFAVLFYPVVLFLTTFTSSKVVVTMHEVISPQNMLEPFVSIKKIYISALNYLIHACSTHLIFLSPITKERFRPVTNTEFSQLSHGTRTDPPLSETKATSKEGLGFNPADTVVVEPGYVSPRKGTELFVSLAEEFKDAEFLLAGGPEDGHEQYFKDVTSETPSNVTTTGELSERDFYRAFNCADAVVLPHTETTADGFENKVAQSGVFNWCATYGVPVLASDLQYFEYLEDEYGCVNTFEEGNVDAAFRALRSTMAHEESESLSDNIRDYATENSLARVAQQHVRIYKLIN